MNATFPFSSETYAAPKYRGLEVFSADRETAREQAKKEILKKSEKNS